MLSAEHAQELYDVYREYNHRRHDELIRGYEGVAEVLDGLRAAGRRLGIVTSKSADTTQMAFRAVGLREHFEVVVTASDTTEHKPSPVPLRLCLERFGAPAEGALYVGDSPVDIEAGRAAGMATAAVAWGVFGREALAGLRSGLLARRARRAARPVPARRGAARDQPAWAGCRAGRRRGAAPRRAGGGYRPAGRRRGRAAARERGMR